MPGEKMTSGLFPLREIWRHRARRFSHSQPGNPSNNGPGNLPTRCQQMLLPAEDSLASFRFRTPATCCTYKSTSSPYFADNRSISSDTARSVPCCLSTNGEMTAIRNSSAFLEKQPATLLAQGDARL